MPKPTFTSTERAVIYKRLFHLNRSFHLIVRQLHKLGKAHIINARDLRDMLGLTQEVQTEINTILLNPLESAEHSDHTHFGQVRLTLEKRLRGKS